MAPLSQRPARYSVSQLREIAARLRAPLPTDAPAFVLLGCRRERFVRAVDLMMKGYEARAPRTVNFRALHQTIGRAFREVFVSLKVLRRLPPSFPEKATADELLAAHFPNGLGFTQEPLAILVRTASERSAAMLDDPRLGMVSENIVACVRVIATLAVAAPSFEQGPPSGTLASAIQSANLALHSYARLVGELATVELTADQATALRQELAVPDADDLPRSN